MTERQDFQANRQARDAVLLSMFRLGDGETRGTFIRSEGIQEDTGLTVQQIRVAFEYWHDKGLIEYYRATGDFGGALMNSEGVDHCERLLDPPSAIPPAGSAQSNVIVNKGIQVGVISQRSSGDRSRETEKSGLLSSVLGALSSVLRR